MTIKSKLGTGVARILGWKLEVSPLPSKCVIVGAPHTSNWDGILMVIAGMKGGYRLHFLGKSSLFRPPLGWFLRRIGGIPVERSHPHGLVGAMQQEFAEHDTFRLAITPEGTRSLRPYWKSGFYRIALGANVPVALGWVDKQTRTAGIRPGFYLTGDMTRDMDKFREFYQDKVGIRAQLGGPVRLKDEGDAAGNSAAAATASPTPSPADTH